MSPPQDAIQLQALYLLLGLTALFLVVSAMMIIALAVLVRRSFWVKPAEASDDAWRAQLMHLPLGVPEGSVRALLSIYVIVFGLLVLVMRTRLGLANVDAVTGFIGVVITFYFTTRGADQTQRVVNNAADAAAKAREAAERVHQAIGLAVPDAKVTAAAAANRPGRAARPGADPAQPRATPEPGRNKE